MVDAANATPGQINTATSPVASHNLFTMLRILVSFVIVHLPLSSSQTLAPAARQSGSERKNSVFEETLHRTRHASNSPSRA